MAQTKYQSAALEYAKYYLDRIFEMEDYMGQKLEKTIDTIVEKKLQNHL